MITRFLNIFNIRQMLSASVLLLMTVTFVLTLFSVEKIAFAEPAEVTPGCASLLSSSSEKGLPLTFEEISQHVNVLADFYLDLFHGPNASQNENFLREHLAMQAKLAEHEALIPDISTRLSRVVEERFPQFEEAMSAKEHEKAERLRESEEQLREIEKLDVCSRTPQVRDEIMRLLGATNCEEITRADLKKITELNLRPMGHNKISVLNNHDFYGLSSLETLNLYGNQLSALPEGVFAGLSSLEWLHLRGNQLSDLPEGVFAGLSSLEKLDLRYNQLSDLPEGVFAGLSSLETLYLSNNANFNFKIALLKDLKTMKGLSLPKHLENSLVTAELRKLLPGTKIYFY